MFQEYFSLRQSGSRQAICLRNRIVEANMGLARKTAHREMSKYPDLEHYDDLEQIAVIGLIKAIEKFDPNRGAAFSSFAVPWIVGEIQHYFRDQWGINPKIPRRLVEFSSQIERVKKRFGELDEAAIARGLRVSPEKVREGIEIRTRKPVKSLEQDALQLGEDSPIEEDYSWIKSRIARLPEPYQSIVIDLKLRKQTIKQIARRRKLKAEEVQSLADEGLLKLKATSPNRHECPSC